MNKKTFFDYEGFVEKFKPKKTTDDCYTPPEVYEVIKDWVCNRYGINPCTIVRPFYPGGDFENFNYPEGCLVLDNPPFSILAKIKRFYLEKGIKFFLFAPSLTLFSSHDWVKKVCHIVTGVSIIYENKARVNTSFITNLDKQYTAFTAPDLNLLIKAALKKDFAKKPVFLYPDEICTAGMLDVLSNRGIKFFIPKEECLSIYKLDAQKKHHIYGKGLLLSPRLAAEKKQAIKNSTYIWPLSDREKELSRSLDCEKNSK